jgi:LPXTG-site transpeptidase (sortase) family protein
MKDFLKIASTSLIIAGFIILVFIYLPVLIIEFKYQVKKNFSNFNNSSQLKFTLNQKDQQRNIKSIKPVSKDFSLIIPKINVNSKIIANVDSSNEKIYLQVLKQGVAHDKNSSLPDEKGAVFLFSHSTDRFYNINLYNAQFYLLNKLGKNDLARLVYKGNDYLYTIADKKIVDPEKVEKTVKDLKGDWLVMQTCWPPGTTLKRLLVLAELEK